MEWDPPEVLRVKNRRVMAERMEWPPGVVEACERVEKRTGWWVSWLPENKTRGFERPATFWAQRDEEPREVYAVDANALIDAIEMAPTPRAWLRS